MSFCTYIGGLRDVPYFEPCADHLASPIALTSNPHIRIHELWLSDVCRRRSDLHGLLLRAREEGVHRACCLHQLRLEMNEGTSTLDRFELDVCIKSGRPK